MNSKQMVGDGIGDGLQRSEELTLACFRIKCLKFMQVNGSLKPPLTWKPQFRELWRGSDETNSRQLWIFCSANSRSNAKNAQLSRTSWSDTNQFPSSGPVSPAARSGSGRSCSGTPRVPATLGTRLRAPPPPLGRHPAAEPRGEPKCATRRRQVARRCQVTLRRLLRGCSWQRMREICSDRSATSTKKRLTQT